MSYYCPKCGAELDDRDSYCSVCGYEIKIIPPKRNSQITQTTGNGKTLAIAFAAIVLIGGGIGGFYLLNNKPNSVNMNPYLDVTFKGTDGDGYAECSFDLSKLISDHEKVFSLNDEKRKKIKQICHITDTQEMSDNNLITFLFADLYNDGLVSVQIEPEDGLSNNDKVTVLWTGGEETLEDLFGVNFIFDHSTFTVRDLKEGVAKTDISDTATAENENVTGTTETAETTTVEHENTAEETPETVVTATPKKKTEKPKTKTFGKYKLANTDYLTLRSTPTINNKNNKILQIPTNSEVTVLEFGCNGYWKVKYNGTEGYILPSYLAPAKGAVSPKKTADYRIITDYVTLRDIPSTDGEEKNKIFNGAIVEYYDSADNGYILVQYNGQLGYILKNYQGEVLIEKIK